MNRPLDFSGRRVVVTHGEEALGRQISERFLGAGADVIICSPHQPSTLPAADGREASYYACELNDPEKLAGMFARIRQDRGPVDTLINNPGELHLEPAENTTDIIDNYLITPLNISQAAYQSMAEPDARGSIIFIAGQVDASLSPTVAAYRAATAGIHNLVTSLAVEWAPAIRVNAVAAGPQHLTDGTDLCNACLFLASPLSDYISGSTLTPGASQTSDIID